MTPEQFGMSPHDEARSEQRASSAVFAVSVAAFYLTLIEEDVDRSVATHLTGNFINTCLRKDQQ